MFTLFEKPCVKCGEGVLGPRLNGKARGAWLGYDCCLKCRAKEEKEAE